MRFFLKLIVLGPIAIAAILLAVANRGSVRIVVDPFGGEGAAGFDLPLFAVMLGFLTLGLLLGGFGTWLSQHRYRKAAKSFRRMAERNRIEADRLRAELADRPAGATGSGHLPAPRAAA